jgi:hypothetical protein
MFSYFKINYNLNENHAQMFVGIDLDFSFFVLYFPEVEFLREFLS